MVLRSWLIHTFVITLVASVLFGIGQPIPEQQARADEHQEIANQTPPPAAKTPASPHSEIERTRSNKNTQSIWHKGFGPNAWPNWALVIVGVGGILVAVRTLNAIASQAQTMERQTAATEKAAEAAKKSADAVINGERAWMVGTEPSYVVETNTGKIQNIFYGCSIKNVGKTPSRIQEVGLTLRKIDSLEKIVPDPTPTYRKEEIRQFSGIMVVPGESLAIRPVKLSEELSWAENAAIDDHKLFVYGYGFVKYLDVFDYPRESRFCHYYFVPGPEVPKDERGFGPCIKAPPEYHKAT